MKSYFEPEFDIVRLADSDVFTLSHSGDAGATDNDPSASDSPSVLG